MVSALSFRARAQEAAIELDLLTTVQLANDSSLAAFRAKNSYVASHWEYRAFKANRLPSLSLYLTPISYNRDYTRRYDSEQNIDVYRRQQSFYSYGNLAAQQNLDITGGTFFIDSELGYIRNLGDQAYSQFSSVPVRVGYRQNLIGYNPFKWEKRIAPVRYEKAQQELIYQLEQTAETATAYFFDLAMAQAEHELALENVTSSDTLYRIGVERFKLNFAQGGFASFILLSGITINASIYILDEFNRLRKQKPRLTSLQAYLKAWNAKIIPIFNRNYFTK